MTLTDFYNYAVLAAQEYGYKKPDIKVIIIYDNLGINHICKLWDKDKKIHIASTIQNNPISAIKAFRDALDYENKTYSKLSEDVDI